jgi:hypothetical integral membrane protein (TIGR02206 family)
MRQFFSVYKGNHDQFLIFSSLHIIVLVTLSAIILSMIIFKKSLRQRADFYRYLIVIISLVLEYSSLVWVVGIGKWDLKTSLPLELCEITFILCIIMLIGKSYKLFEVAYFWGFIGSSLALIFPSLHISYHHFPFWAFMLTHSLNIISLVFMMSIEKYKPTRKSILVSFMITNIYMFLMITINYLLGSNYYYHYVFKKPAPGIPNPFMYTNSWFFKILMLEVITFIALLICYLPFAVANVFKRKYPC